MTEKNPSSDGARLLDLLSRQRDLYQRLRELSNRQRDLIAGDQPELLLGILRERQSLVQSLAQINDELAPYRRQWHTLYNALPAAQQGQAVKLLEEINSMLTQILKADQEDSALLSARKQVVGSELRNLSGGQQANAAYAQAARRSDDAAADMTG